MKTLAKNIALALLAGVLSVAVLPGQADAGWGRYRVVTSYSTPSVPSYAVTQRVVVRRPHHSVVAVPVYPAPVVYSPAPRALYYSAPAGYVVPAQSFRVVSPTVRATYFAPAPAIYYPYDVVPFYLP